MSSPIITSSSSLRATYLRQNFAIITVYVTSRVLRVPLELVKVRVSWSGRLESKKKEKKEKKVELREYNDIYVSMRKTIFFFIHFFIFYFFFKKETFIILCIRVYF